MGSEADDLVPPGPPPPPKRGPRACDRAAPLDPNSPPTEGCGVRLAAAMPSKPSEDRETADGWARVADGRPQGPGPRRAWRLGACARGGG